MIAISLCPGGSMFNEYSVGFDWKKNFISNLFAARAINGAENPARIWAYFGMIFLPLSYAIFFIHMSKKIPDKKAATIIKSAGVINILFTALTITRYHDLMLNISITLFWTCIVIITASILKTRLHLFKVLCIICLIIFYYSLYLWGTSNWHLLPIMQKVNFINSTLLILGLEHFTSREDFAAVNLASSISSRVH
ncbi:MAG: hypothetical protein V4717_20445 [Bacteroidota bacterium]